MVAPPRRKLRPMTGIMTSDARQAATQRRSSRMRSTVTPIFPWHFLSILGRGGFALFTSQIPSAVPARRWRIGLHGLNPLQHCDRRTVTRHGGERDVEAQPRVVEAAGAIGRKPLGIAACAASPAASTQLALAPITSKMVCGWLWPTTMSRSISRSSNAASARARGGFRDQRTRCRRPC